MVFYGIGYFEALWDVSILIRGWLRKVNSRPPYGLNGQGGVLHCGAPSGVASIGGCPVSG